MPHRIKTISVPVKKARVAIVSLADTVALDFSAFGTDHWQTPGSGGSVTRNFYIQLTSYPAQPKTQS